MTARSNAPPPLGSYLSASLLLQTLCQHLEAKMIWLGIHGDDKGCNVDLGIHGLVSEHWSEDLADL